MNRASQFALVRKEGVSAAGRFLVLGALAQPDVGEKSCFGIICTKKVGCAVVRNKIRRRIREIIRAHGEPFQYGFYMVCVLRWRAARADFAALSRDWERTADKLAQQLGIFFRT